MVSLMPPGPSGPVVSNVFGVLAAGRPVLTAFTQTNATPGQEKFAIILERPSTVGELSVFLLPGKPSAVFRTGWPTNPDVAMHPVIQIGVSVEPADTVAAVLATCATAESERLAYAQLVARDVFNYLSSFAKPLPGGGDQLVIPGKALMGWLEKFEARFKHDPNFLLHSQKAQP